MGNKPAIFVILFAGMQLNTAVAQDFPTFPGVEDDARTLHVQQRVDELFEQGDYERAFFIYRNELAPIGDKYAQYMLGFMYLTGKGVAEDRITASAWYRLAAERGTPQFVAERNKLIASLEDTERARSDQMYLALRRELSDLAILVRLLQKDQERLAERTGSRLSSGSSSLLIVDPRRPGSMQSGDAYYGQIRKRMQVRLSFLRERAKIEIGDTPAETVDLASVEADVQKHLETIAD